MTNYMENSMKYNKMLDLHEKIKEDQHELYMEREKNLLKELKSTSNILKNKCSFD